MLAFAQPSGLLLLAPGEYPQLLSLEPRRHPKVHGFRLNLREGSERSNTMRALYPRATVVIRDRSNNVLLVKYRHSDEWELPGRRLNADTDPTHVLISTISQRVGLNIHDLGVSRRSFCTEMVSLRLHRPCRRFSQTWSVPTFGKRFGGTSERH